MNRYDMTLDGTENNLVQGLTVENPTGLKATLLSQTGKMQNLFLPYPAKGTLSFPNGRLEDVPIHFEAENGKWFAVRENTARYEMCIRDRAYFAPRIVNAVKAIMKLVDWENDK